MNGKQRGRLSWFQRLMLRLGYRKETDGERTERLASTQKERAEEILRRQEVLRRQYATMRATASSRKGSKAK